jgi:type III pantothenate kinase
MLLAIDAGNTNVVAAVHDGEHWRGQWRIATQPERTGDEYAVWLLTLFQLSGLKPGDITRAALGTVVPPTLYPLRRLCRDRFGIEPLIARAAGDLDWGFAIKTDNPHEVGADRLLNALAAQHRYPTPLMVVDFGTATTFDVVDEDGAYIGGVIAPGVNLALEALHRAAAQLPRVAFSRPQAVIGRSTIPAMQSGAYWGYIGFVEGLVRRIEAEHMGDLPGADMAVIATGGLATLFSGGTSAIRHVDPDLTLNGLLDLSDRNPALGRRP